MPITITGNNFELSQAVQNWIAQDPTKAENWMERQLKKRFTSIIAGTQAGMFECYIEGIQFAFLRVGKNIKVYLENDAELIALRS